MQWTRVKTIFICLFLVINIALIIVYLNINKNENAISPETVQDTITILNKNDFSLEERFIENKFSSVALFEATNQFSNSKDLVKYVTDNLKLNISENDIIYSGNSFDYTPKTKIGEPVKKYNIKTAQKVAEEFIKDAKLVNGHNYVTEARAKGDNFVFAFNPTFNEIPILDSGLWIEVAADGIVKIVGDNWLCDNIKNTVTVGIRPVTEILTNFAGNSKVKAEVSATSKDEINKIKTLKFGYYTGSREGEIRTVTAVPAWKIMTNNSRFYFDASNGNLIE